MNLLIFSLRDQFHKDNFSVTESNIQSIVVSLLCFFFGSLTVTTDAIKSNLFTSLGSAFNDTTLIPRFQCNTI